MDYMAYVLCTGFVLHYVVLMGKTGKASIFRPWVMMQVGIYICYTYSIKCILNGWLNIILWTLY